MWHCARSADTYSLDIWIGRLLPLLRLSFSPRCRLPGRELVLVLLGSLRVVTAGWAMIPSPERLFMASLWFLVTRLSGVPGFDLELFASSCFFRGGVLRCGLVSECPWGGLPVFGDPNLNRSSRRIEKVYQLSHNWSSSELITIRISAINTTIELSQLNQISLVSSVNTSVC